MPSSFDSTDLFNSGPHRFHLGPFGEQLLLSATIDPTTAGYQAIGHLDALVTVRGRLIADDDAALWALIDAIADKLTHPPLAADLVDHHGHEFKEFAFVSFTPSDRTDRGQRVSLAYEAKFMKFGG
jgi:hypothetical protein